MTNSFEPGPGLRTPEPLSEEFLASRWALDARDRRAMTWKLALVALPMLILLVVAVLAPGAFGAAIEACGGG